MTGEGEQRVRRSRGENSVYWSADRQRFVAEGTVGYNANGKRVTRKGYGTSETAALRELRRKVKDYESGLVTASDRVTVWQVVEDWLDHGQTKGGESTRSKNRILAETHIRPYLGGGKLHRLTAETVDDWLADRAEHLATSTLQQVYRVLNRAVRRALKRRLVTYNVVDLCDVPRGRKPGRPSKSLTMEQAVAVITNTADDPMYAYIVVSLLTGIRTEEVRALAWSNVHLDGAPDANPPLPPHIHVWRSVREGGDTKTSRSRRTLAIPRQVVSVLRTHRAALAAQKLKAGSRWEDTGCVFTNAVGRQLDAANVRRDFRRALRNVEGINPEDWTPRELRHSFVSLLSEHGVTVEEIARLVGHAGGSKVTETVYRHELRPVIEGGAQVMDHLFPVTPEKDGSNDA